VTITAPISGIITVREVSVGQSLQDAGGKLMTIVNGDRVFATGSIYEKDLDKVKNGQSVTLKVSSLPNRIFEGKYHSLEQQYKEKHELYLYKQS
jgi:cobalt-zinc-cadmium efflux system membrane fusion protein